MSTNETLHVSPTGGTKAGNLERYDLIPAGPLDLLARFYGVMGWVPTRATDFTELNSQLWLWWSGDENLGDTGLPRIVAVAAYAFSMLNCGETPPTVRADVWGPRYDLIPAEPLRMLAEHYGRGALKYDDDNWRKGYDWRLSFAALNRHLWQHWAGEPIDEETGSPHLIAVAWHAFTLCEFRVIHPEFDTRLKTIDARAARAIAAPTTDGMRAEKLELGPKDWGWLWAYVNHGQTTIPNGTDTRYGWYRGQWCYTTDSGETWTPSAADRVQPGVIRATGGHWLLAGHAGVLIRHRDRHWSPIDDAA
ncbi:hypothetical protein PBI_MALAGASYROSE_54 [Mycobacterium phage MalagasyRose]|uniref:dATP/dGTP diphosphohydrolase N-terminal domain-containing protein n=1 Tax=Mycobacterium phage MalagasyRose TaxID=2599870 RepID=A0A5J6TJ90_9CAUD|nr:hypothetical protein QEH39_gp34 [Mycobacterium phage MalagasyRose]QFG08902.1 hypothetical protein PBI_MALAGASYROSE_54 [Mycobacterium phage MalagasyRose]